jgi:hypothetical protein
LGGLAIALPILFHLIRRQPKGEVPFSSLIFLRPTPPRLTRRSRLENWPLLLVRGLVLALLAAAFSRPLFRTAAVTDAAVPRSATVLLIDTSASMQRDGLWQQAMDQATAVIDELAAGDQLAVAQFDRTAQVLFSFEQSQRSESQQIKSSANSVLRQLSPTWQRTDLGSAIQFAAEMATAHDHGSDDVQTRIVLIGDMQQSSGIESLQGYSWPAEISLEVRRVVALQPTNAAAMVLTESTSQETSPTEADREPQIRVRVRNSADATNANFQIGWETDGSPGRHETIQVPPGQMRIVELPLPPADIESLVLSGDDHSFDNRQFYVPPNARDFRLLYVGSDAPKAEQSLLYYLQQAPLSNRYRKLNVESIGGQTLAEVLRVDEVPLVIISEAIEIEAAAGLAAYIGQGGRALIVLANADRSNDLIQFCNAVTESDLVATDAEIENYALLSKIDFSHPLFAPFSIPPFNDFSRIRFWSHRQLSNVDDRWSVLANFDTGSPALLETEIGAGKMWILTAGWQPAESQLALSTKFVPLLFQFVDSRHSDAPIAQLSIGDAVPFPASVTATVTTPIGDTVPYSAGDGGLLLDRPGVYEWKDGEQRVRFAVNLSPAESRTEPIDDEVLEQFGIKLTAARAADAVAAADTGQAIDAQQQRKLLDRELESRQRVWQWLLVAALGLIGLETWLAYRIGRQTGKQVDEPSTA